MKIIKCFIAGRFLGENVRLIYDVLFESKKQSLTGLLLSIDFEKAFDTVSWKFIMKVLNYFNFGNSIKRGWVYFKKGQKHVFYKMFFLSNYFSLRRGCRQRDPSPHVCLPFVQRF